MHFLVQSQQKYPPPKQTNKKKNNVSNILKVNHKDTKMMPGASIINFKHISHFILMLLLLNSNK